MILLTDNLDINRGIKLLNISTRLYYRTNEYLLKIIFKDVYPDLNSSYINTTSVSKYLNFLIENHKIIDFLYAIYFYKPGLSFDLSVFVKIDWNKVSN